MPAPESASEDVEARVEEARRALAGDPRLGQLDIEVTLRGHRAVVTGHVVTPERRLIVGQVLADHLPGFEVHNATTTMDALAEPTGPGEGLA